MNIPSVRRLGAATIVVALGFAPWAGAEPPRAEELEQLRINTGYIIEAGEFEIDIVPTYFDHDGASHQSIEAEFEYALTERLMFELEVPYRRVSIDGGEDRNGIGNIELGAKWLVAERGASATAFNIDVELPASDHEPGIAEDLWGVELTLPMSFYFADRHTRLHVEPGVGWEEHEGFEEQLLNVAVEHRPNGGNFALQLGSNMVREESDVEAYLVPAFEVAATTVPFQFGMAVAAGLTSESANWGVLLDFEVEF